MKKIGKIFEFGLDFGYIAGIDVPDVRGNTIVRAIFSLLLILGLGLAISLNDAMWFTGFGSLMVIAAASLAYWGSLDKESLNRWIDATIKEISDLEELWTQMSLGAEEGHILSSPFPGSRISLHRLSRALDNEDWNDKFVYYGTYLHLLRRLNDDGEAKDRLLRVTNQTLHRTEFFVAIVGTAINGFGGLIGPIVKSQY